MEVLRSGVIQYVAPDFLIASKGSKLFVCKGITSNWQKWCSLPVSKLDKCWSSNRWLCRLSRKEAHHLIKVNDQYFACFGFGKVYLIERKTGNVEKIGDIKGSRPLKVCSNGGHIYYGVYTGNEERKPIPLYSYSLANKEWSIVHSFENIRHIHGVFWDEYESKLWVTTGDLNHESTIWCFDKENTPQRVASGSQQTRAVDLLFMEDVIFFSTDAPDAKNYIYRLDRESNNLEKLQAIGGPAFYGKKVEDWLFFSTVAEPSEVNRTDVVELWGSNDQGKTWNITKEFKKDIGPMKLFQYGQIKFPSGHGDKNNLWFTPYAIKHDHQIVKIPLETLSH